MKIEKFSDEHYDFIVEIVNVGAGNAAGALSKLLDSRVEVKQPKVYFEPPHIVSKIIGEPSLSVACVKIAVIGDMFGDMFFILPEKDKAVVIHLAEKSIIGKKKKGPLDISALSEIGNILAGTYLTAIHDFCRLRIYHSIPELIIDMLQAVFDEYLSGVKGISENFITVENEFTIISDKGEVKSKTICFKMFLLFAPSVNSIRKLLDSFDEAKRTLKIG
ncbi:MAG: chemotaxis protein CheC [Nitrospinae bacterium]|nr:chemotaxis protein CheC [Nitrospinota bacterium]